MNRSWGTSATREPCSLIPEIGWQLLSWQVPNLSISGRYGIADTFKPEDLTEMKNVSQVTKCVDELATIVSWTISNRPKLALLSFASCGGTVASASALFENVWGWIPAAFCSLSVPYSLHCCTVALLHCSTVALLHCCTAVVMQCNTVGRFIINDENICI